MAHITKYDSTFRGKSHDFILLWIRQANEYASFCGAKPFDPDLKLTLLQNAFSGHDDLKLVRNTAQIAGKSLTYDEYLPLLESAAHVYDNKQRGQHVRYRQQQVFSAETGDMYYHHSDIWSDDTGEPNAGAFDIDTYGIHYTKCAPPKLGINVHSKIKPLILVPTLKSIFCINYQKLHKTY
jgi:hypothetical protein